MAADRKQTAAVDARSKAAAAMAAELSDDAFPAGLPVEVVLDAILNPDDEDDDEEEGDDE